MNLFRPTLLILSASFLLGLQGVAQDAVGDNPKAAKALSGVLIKNELGGFAFSKHEIATMKNNPQVPGLGGLMFVHYKNDADEQMTVSVQWFEDQKKLMKFFEDQLKRQRKVLPQLKKVEVGGNVVWSVENTAYYWTDSKTLMVSLGGKKVPLEFIKGYLKKIPSGLGEKAADKKE